jgi:hypothetical protein
MEDGSEWDELDEMSLRASQLALSDELPVNETANNESTDPGLLAERYWALPAESRQLLDDLVRTRWQLSNASLADAVLEPHENGTEPQTGMKLEAVWNGDEQICVRVVEAESRSGVQAGDILKTVEGIDCSKKSLAEVGHLIAEANRDKLSVQIGMLRNGTQGQAGGGEVGGGGKASAKLYSLTLERGWLTAGASDKVRERGERGEREGGMEGRRERGRERERERQ